MRAEDSNKQMAPKARGLRALFILALLGSLVGLSAPAGASETCGDISLLPTDVRLLNNAVDTDAGPFPIDLAAGRYEITLVSRDDHDLHHQPEQDQEQWRFSLDSGFVSSPSVDLPTDQNEVTTHLGVHDLKTSASISLHHIRQGGVNSVQPVCVGFTAVAVVDDVVDAAVDDPVPVTVEDPVDVEVEGVVEFAQETALVPPQMLSRPPTADVRASSTPGPAPQLALTGPGLTTSIALTGILTTILGLVCVSVESLRGRSTNRSG